MIKFPKVHIAASVVNRILDVASGIQDEQRVADATRAPLAPGPTVAMQSVALDQKLAQGTPDVGGIDQAPDPGATLAGDPLLQTLMKPGA